MHRDRYCRLYNLLSSGRVEICVVPKDRVFVHGKAGVIEAADGSQTCFLGSINETKNAFAHNIEDDWIETAEKLEAMMHTYLYLRQQSRDVFQLRYRDTLNPDQNRWELCSRALARKDIVEKLSEAW